MRSLRAVGVPVLFFLLGGAVAASAAVPPKVIAVKTPAQLQSAFASVPDGGVIELAAGVYPAAGKGFSISNPRKGFTVRAAAGAAVALDGQGKGTVLRFKNGDRSKGKLVIFQGITFQNGASLTEGDAGGVSLNAAEARFVQCNFLRNKATGKTTGGGAARLFANSSATFVRSNFRNNSSGNRGGAIEAIASSLTIQGGEFTDNRTNLPGHLRTSPGGAIYALDATVLVSDARFERNETGWTGGAIYAFGHWTDPVTAPKALVTVIRSTFLANRAAPDPCCTPPSSTSGGAVHVEDQSTLKVFGSQFFDNAADVGGALDSYRAVIEVNGSIFLGNRTPVQAGKLGVGGAIAVASNDSKTDGTVNRRPGSLSMTDSLLQGGVAPPATPANAGGCLAAEGDWSRVYGISIPALGTLADNRAPVALHRVTFADCDAAKSSAGGGLGGAISAAMVDLVMDGSLIFDSDARGDTSGGGALALQRESTAVITGTTFAHDTSQQAGGALFLNGSTAQVAGCRFLRNAVAGSPSRGADLYAIPQLGGLLPPRDVGGLVTGSLFSESSGTSVWDVDPANGPFNEMRYDGNQFYSYGGPVYFNSAAVQGGGDTSTLNNLVIYHSGRQPLDKGNGNNPLFSLPRVGTLLASPSSLGTGAPAATASFLAYAWSGGSANLAGQTLNGKAGLLGVSTAGTQTLTVDGTSVATAQLAAKPAATATALSLSAGRFRLEARWTDASGHTGEAQPVALSDGAGYFWVGSEAEPALIAQITDETLPDGGLRLYRGERAGLGFTVTLTDAQSGESRAWSSSPE
jgi:hypothetical protein